MLNTYTENTLQIEYERVADTERYLRRYGPELCKLFDAFDAASGFDALCDLHATLSSQCPDVSVITTALREIESVLAKQTSQDTDKVAQERGFEACSAVRWHGARIHDLLSRFQNVC